MWFMFIKFPVSMNDKGKNVGKISDMLIKHGSNIKHTEEFTIGMKSAVKSFQKKHYLEPTGVVDKLTWKELKKNPEKSK